MPVLNISLWDLIFASEGLFLSIVGRYPLNHEKAGEKIRKPTASKSAVVPLKFNAQLDGISGIVIGNVFKIDSSRLPELYKNNKVAFVVMGEDI